MKAIAILILAFALALSSCTTTALEQELLPTPQTDLVGEIPAKDASQPDSPAPSQETISDEPSQEPLETPMNDGQQEATEPAADEPSQPVEADGEERPVQGEALEDGQSEDTDDGVGFIYTMNDGEAGPSGGTVFNNAGTSLEVFVIDVDGKTYEEALTMAQSFAIITKTNAFSGWRLPTKDELLAIYHQLFETYLAEFEETYYWAYAPQDSQSAPVLYFGTGFESDFYKDMDFVGVMVVRNL